MPADPSLVPTALTRQDNTMSLHATRPSPQLSSASRPVNLGGSLRRWLAGKGYAVGESAQAAAPGAKKMSWREIAQMAGINDFKGSRKDERFREVQDAFYNPTGPGGATTEYAKNLEAWANANRDFGSGSGGGSGDPGSDTPGNLGSDVSTRIRDLLSGKESPFGQDAIDRLKASAFEDAAGGVEAAQRSAGQRAQRSGGLYSASAGSAAAEAERSGRSDFSQAARGIEQAATEKNFEARMQGLSSGLQLLQQEREERMANARNDVERESIAKQYQGLIESTRMKIESEQQLAQQANAAAGAAGSAGRSFEREMAAMRWEQELNRRAYEEPWRLADMGLNSFGGE